MNPSQPDATAAQTAPPADAFRFGRNWQRYVHSYLDADRERIAMESLQDLVGELDGKTFLDIGCGSGLFSLCAYRAGAAEVISLDVDPEAVSSTNELRSRAGAPSSWRVLHRSILDQSLPEDVAPADVVYAWGVLHHTGDMYTAIRSAASLVKPGGVFAIAIYNRVTRGLLTSEQWRRIKRTYNRAPRTVQVIMEFAYAGLWSLVSVRNKQNPLRAAREYRRSRGMALWTDLVDWLGGYPYEFATASEITEFCEASCGVRTVRVMPVPSDGTGCHQFVFKRPPAGADGGE